VRLKGKNKALSIFECLDGYNESELDKKLKLLPVFNEAIRSYHEQRFENATRLFQMVVTSDPDEQTANLYIEKSLKYLREGVPENWTGADEMMTK
jgi:hypothetical protein